MEDTYESYDYGWGYEEGVENGRSEVLDDLAPLYRDLKQHLERVTRENYQAHYDMLVRVERELLALGVLTTKG